MIAAAIPRLAAQAEERPYFGEVVDVNVVNVEVYVTDRSGAAVNGLEAEDFAVTVDGRPVEITNFYIPTRSRPDRADRQDPEDPGPDRGSPPRPPLARVPIPESQRLNLIVFIDNFNIRPLDRNRVFPRLREFLVDHVGPGDRVMLVSYERSVKIEHPFTDSPAAIARALSELESTPGHRLQDDAERDRLLRSIEEASDSSVIQRVRMYARSLDNDLRFTLDALKEFIEPLAGVPGRKAILHVSDGMPMTPAQDLFYALQEKFNDESIFNESLQLDQTLKLQELAATANANRVTFYTIDAAGLRVHSAAEVDRRGSGFNRLTPTADLLHVSNIQSTIRLLADTTGGIAIVNTNDFGPGLERVAADLEFFYSLGFESPFDRDGRFHKIKVEVRDKALRVRHREGYRDKSAAAVMADGTRSALLFGHEANPLAVRLAAGGQQRQDDGAVRVVLAVEVPFSSMVLAADGDRYRGDLQLSFAVMADDGSQAPLEQVAVPVTLPVELLEAALTESFVFEAPLLMRPGHHRVAVGVRDNLSGEASYATTFVAVGLE